MVPSRTPTPFLLLVLQAASVTMGAWAVADASDTCLSGSESDGREGCVPCRVGFYREQGAQLECEPCPRSWITHEVGAWRLSQCNLAIGSRDLCPSGQEWRSDGESCAPCRQGTYRTKSIDYWCVPCPKSRNTTEEGGVSVDDCIVQGCVDGAEWNPTSRSCEPCPLGYYGVNGLCQICPDNHVTLFRGSRSPFECIPLNGKEYSFTEEDCPAGTQYDEALNVCKICPKDTYRATTDPFTSCLPCPEGLSTYTEGATSSLLCMDREQLIILIRSIPAAGVSCPLGTEWAEWYEPGWGRLSGCRPCPWGMYRDQFPQRLCQLCPPGSTTFLIGSISSSLCITDMSSASQFTTPRMRTPPSVPMNVFDPADCPAGTEWNVTHSACMVCSQGAYSVQGTSPTCVTCPEGRTTLTEGAKSVAQCALMKSLGSPQTFFTALDCPLGSEWDALARACRPCPLGWYRENPDMPTCSVCPAGLTTLTPGSMSRFLCAVPLEGPDKTIIGSDGCDPGYHESGNKSYCAPCVPGTFKDKLGRGPCIPCPKGPDDEPLKTPRRGATHVSQCLPTGHVKSIRPAFGPQSGGTIIDVFVQSAIDFRVVEIRIAAMPCKLMGNYLVDGTVSCMTSPVRSLPPPEPLYLEVMDGIVLTSWNNFTYKSDPVITMVTGLQSIVSGGLAMTVRGTSLDSVTSPALLLYNKRPSLDGLDRLSWLCTVVNSGTVRCPFPDVAQLIKSGRRKHRATGSDATAEFYTGFNLDGVMYYRNMSDVMPQYGTFTLQPDPVLYPFEDKDGIRMLAEGDVTFEIRGMYLDEVATMSDYRIQVGSCRATVKSLNNTLLTADVCSNLAHAKGHRVSVSVISVSRKLGEIQISSATSVAAKKNKTLDIVIPLLVAVACIVLLVIICITVYIYKKKEGKKRKQYSPDSTMMSQAAQNGHVVDPRLPPLPVDSVFGPERVTVMPGAQGFTAVRSKRDRGVSMRQLALPIDGMSVVEAVEIGNQDLLRFEVDMDDGGGSGSPVGSDLGGEADRRDTRPGTSPTAAGPADSARSDRSESATYKPRYHSRNPSRPLSNPSSPAHPPPTPPPLPALEGNRT